MTFHAPQSRARIATILFRRAVLNRTSLTAIAAAITTTVVLAGRGTDIDATSGNNFDISTSSIALGHLGLPASSPERTVSDVSTSAGKLPETLQLQRPADKPIESTLYRQGRHISVTSPAQIAVPGDLEDNLAPTLETTESKTDSPQKAPKAIRVASLSSPRDDWDALQVGLSLDSPDLGSKRTAPTLRSIQALDVSPEIDGLESGPVVETLTARSGEILEQMLARASIRDADRRATLVALRADAVSTSLSEGDMIDIAVLSPKDNQLLAIRLRQVGKSPVELRWDGDSDALWTSINLQEEIKEVALPKQEAAPETLSVTGKQDDTIFVAGDISSSLYSSAAKAGLTAGETKALSDIFRYSIDFERDLRKGDRFEALFEKGENGSYGDILYAKLTNRGSDIALYRGVDDVTGEAGYFDAAGKTNKRTLMRTPLAGAQVSSHFGMRRHPVLGYNKMHRGTDFRARTGTPIYAAGDGVVESIGRKGAYGKYIRIRHNGSYETAYAHMSNYAKGLNYGDRVRQGEVIGYVGSTGRSTGPHLHFEILKNGSQINPLKIADFGPVKGLSGAALSHFKVRVSRIEIALTLMRNNTRVVTAQ